MAVMYVRNLLKSIYSQHVVIIVGKITLSKFPL